MEEVWEELDPIYDNEDVRIHTTTSNDEPLDEDEIDSYILSEQETKTRELANKR